MKYRLNAADIVLSCIVKMKNLKPPKFIRLPITLHLIRTPSYLALVAIQLYKCGLLPYVLY